MKRRYCIPPSANAEYRIGESLELKFEDDLRVDTPPLPVVELIPVGPGPLVVTLKPEDDLLRVDRPLLPMVELTPVGPEVVVLMFKSERNLTSAGEPSPAVELTPAHAPVPDDSPRPAPQPTPPA